MSTVTDTPKVWIGCLAAYNNGHLHGEWVEATDVDELNEGRDRVLKSSPIPGAEEAFIADTDGFPSGVVGEYESFERVAAFGALLEEHGDPARAFLGWLDSTDDVEIDDLDDYFHEAYRGEHEDEKHFIYDLVDDLAIFYVHSEDRYGPSLKIPDDHPCVIYFDWDHYAQEQFRHGPYSFVRLDGVYGHGFVFEEGTR